MLILLFFFYTRLNLAILFFSVCNIIIKSDSITHRTGSVLVTACLRLCLYVFVTMYEYWIVYYNTVHFYTMYFELSSVSVSVFFYSPVFFFFLSGCYFYSCFYFIVFIIRNEMAKYEWGAIQSIRPFIVWYDGSYHRFLLTIIQFHSIWSVCWFLFVKFFLVVVIVLFHLQA